MLKYIDLVNFHRAYSIVPSPLSDEALCAYFMALDHRKNLIVEQDFEFQIIGLTEFWRINYEQLGRIVVHGSLDAREEDTTSGEIAFVANTMVHPEHKNQGIFESMKVKFFLANYTCKFFAGDSQRRKHHKSFNIYPRTELISKYKEATNGISIGE